MVDEHDVAARDADVVQRAAVVGVEDREAQRERERVLRRPRDLEDGLAADLVDGLGDRLVSRTA